MPARRNKIVFLDVDGVLNSHEYFTTNGHLKLGPDHMDPVPIGRLNRLVKVADADVCISSSWRHYFTIPEMKKMLGDRGFEYSDRIIGQTPSKMSNHWRGNEIQWWLDDQYTEKKKKRPAFVILDDNADMLHLKPYLVQTNHVVGLQDTDVDRALELLKKQPKPFKYNTKDGLFHDEDGGTYSAYDT